MDDPAVQPDVSKIEAGYNWLRRMIVPEGKPLSWIAFSRGVVGTFIALGFLADAMDISRYEIVRAVHAITVGWDILADLVGRLLGNFPLIPVIPGSLINTALFITSVSIPALFGIWREAPDKRIRADKNRKGDRGTFESTPLMICFSGLVLVGPVVFEGASLESIRLVAQDMSTSTSGDWLGWANAILMYVFCIGLAVCFAMLLRSYRIGAFLVIAIVLVVEVLYFAPIVGDVLTRFADTILDAGASPQSD